jgi:hypothetical protein
MARVRPAVIAALAAIGLCACGGAPALTAHGGGCSGGVTQPLHRARVLDSLHAAGFSVNATTRSEECAPADADAAFAISNAPEGSDAYARLQEQQGILHCTLYRKPVFDDRLRSDLHEHASSPMFNGRKARFWFKNLECLLYAGDANQDRQVASLARSMRVLAR